MWFYLDSRQHDGDQVVVWEQEGADDAAVTDVLDDGWERKRGECEQVREGTGAPSEHSGERPARDSLVFNDSQL